MSDGKGRRPLTSKERKSLKKQRKNAAKQAEKYHKEKAKQDKRAKKSPNPKKEQQKKAPKSKIEEAFLKQKEEQESQRQVENMSREEKFRRKGKAKIKNLKPKDYEDGYYVDEFGEKQKQEKRAKEIRAQEREVIRRRKKSLTSTQIKHRRIALYSSIFAAVLIIGVILSLTVLFKTEKIEVVGDKYYDEKQIIAFSGVEYQENIFMGAMYNTSDKIVKNLSYIESASVSFNIPDTITITVVDATPSYVIPNGNGYLLVSSKGRILEEISENKDKLPELTCGDIKTTEVGQYVSFSDANVPDILEDVSQSLINNKVKNITGFDVTDTANIKLVYDGRIDINIGLPDDIDYKIRTAMTIINEKLDPNNTGLVAGTLDVSACSTSKISHYKPAATQPTAATQATTQATTQAADSSADTGDGYTGNYTWDGGTYSGGDTGYYRALSEDEIAGTEEFAIVKNPESVEGVVGETAEFTVEATGKGLTYEWQYCNANSTKWRTSVMEGSDTATVKVPVANWRDGQKYRCVVTNGDGEQLISETAVVTMQKPIKVQPVSVEAVKGTTAEFTVETSWENVTYQWEYCNANSNKWRTSSMEGNDTATIKVPAGSWRNGQKYRCVITGADGRSVTSEAATLTVTDK